MKLSELIEDNVNDDIQWTGVFTLLHIIGDYDIPETLEEHITLVLDNYRVLTNDSQLSIHITSQLVDLIYDVKYCMGIKLAAIL